MLINATAAEEIRMAVVEDGILTDLDIETQTREKSKGNIYKGIVANVEASLNCAFIEFGHAKQGFLAFDDLRPELWEPEWKGDGKPRITDVLKRGQHVVVQVIKEEMGTKGAAVTTYLSLPGRYVVLMHSGGGRGGVSRKIDDERERARAKDALDRLKVPDDLGVIIRTAGIGKSRSELQKDLNALSRTWAKIFETASIARPPSLLYREPDLVVRTIRDYLTSDVDEVLVDDADEYEEALSYFADEDDAPAEDAPSEVEQAAEAAGLGDPTLDDGEKPAEEPAQDEQPAERRQGSRPPPPARSGKDVIKLYEGKTPLFERYGVEDQIEALYKRQVPLPSGGYLIIDQTEALVAIDVNSGKSTREDDHESTVYKTNLEAVTEVARQLRLRDMGGIVVVDLIDMASRKHDRDVEHRFKEAIKQDRARIKIGRISENGLMELTRQRLRAAHRLVSHVPCPTCTGTGVIRAVPGQAVAALRELQARASAAQGLLARVAVRLPLDVANFLTNNKRKELEALAQQHDMKVEVLADHTLSHGESKVEEERRGRAGMNAPALPSVKEDDWRSRRNNRFRGREEGGAPERELSIEERQEKRFEEDTGRRGRGRWEKRDGGDRGRDGGRDRDRGRDRPAPEAREPQEAREPREPRERAPAPAAAAPAPAVPRHYPDDPLMDALFGDPPALLPEPAAAAPAPGSAAPGTPDGTAAPAVTAAVAVAPGAPADGAAAPLDGPVALGPDGQPLRKKRRRRRRRRGKGPGAEGGAMPNAAPGAAGQDDGGDDGDDDEDGDDAPANEGAAAAPAEQAGLEAAVALQPEPAMPATQRDLMEAAAAVILAGPAPDAPPLAAVEEAPAAEEVLAQMEANAAAGAAVDADPDDEDDATDASSEELPPLPPAEAGQEGAPATGEAPTVVAKKGAAKKARGKAAPRGRRKPGPRKDG